MDGLSAVHDIGKLLTSLLRWDIGVYYYQLRRGADAAKLPANIRPCCGLEAAVYDDEGRRCLSNDDFCGLETGGFVNGAESAVASQQPRKLAPRMIVLDQD